jgi:hypothetical protein
MVRGPIPFGSPATNFKMSGKPIFVLPRDSGLPRIPLLLCVKAPKLGFVLGEDVGIEGLSDGGKSFPGRPIRKVIESGK